MSNKVDQNLTLVIDEESVNIFRDGGEFGDPIHVCCWHEDEWLEDPELVVPAMLRAVELYYTNQVELLETLRLNDLILKDKQVTPIRETGGSKTATIQMSYQEIVDIIGEPNVTDMDDPDKVKASWGFIDNKGRKGFIWSYKFYEPIVRCNYFSADGNKELLKELFGDAVE